MFATIEDLLKKNFTETEKSTIDYLVDCGQEAVLLRNKSVERIGIKLFIKEISTFDSFYPGGLKKYIEKCRDLLLKSSQGVNPFDGWIPSIPPTVDVSFNTKEFHELEKEGLDELTHCGFILIAGGLGERLGYDNIKVGLPIETFTNLSYLHFYIQKILSIQHRSSNPHCTLPFAIMTSENNHDLTVDYLENNNYFGMPKEQIYIMTQDCIPAVLNLAGEIAVDDQGHVIRKPHGHGDIHFCLFRDHVIEQWLEKYDISSLFFFQDTNTVNFQTMPVVAALKKRLNAHMLSTCVKRRPHEQTGGLCKLVNEKGEVMICNVEYNQLEDVIKNTIDPRGDFGDEEGFSPFPGNCNNLCMDIRDYYRVISLSSGIVPEFVNPKYKPGSKKEFIVPARLESLMQDYPKLLFEAQKQLEVNSKCLVVTFPRFMAWSPVKNDYQRAAILREKTGYEESPRSGEADILNFFKEQLLSVNECPICNPENKQRIVIEEGAYVCLWPEAGVSTEELHHHIGEGVVIKKGSVVVIRCRNWYLNNVMIDGCLVMGGEEISESDGYYGSITLSDVTIKNKGWKYEEIDKTDTSISIIYRMRGYVVKREESCIFNLKSKGNYVVEHTTYAGNCSVDLDR